MRCFLLILLSLAAACSAAPPEPEFLGVYRCGPELVVDAWRREDALRLATLSRTFELERVPSASGVRWAGDGASFHEEGSSAVFVLAGERHVCGLEESLMQAIRGGVDYRAVGQEPGWLLDIFEGERLVLEYDYAQKTATLPYVEPVEKAGGRTIVSEQGGERIEVTIKVATCRDAMSGQPYPDTVTVRYRNADIERRLEGCGRSLPK